MPEGGLNIRLRDTILGQEARLHDYKRDAMLAFVRANKLNRYITSGGRNPKIGIITVGKSYLDVRQAFDELGIDEVKCNDLGIRLYKVAASRSTMRRPTGSRPMISWRAAATATPCSAMRRTCSPTTTRRCSPTS
jgi:indolepyruvate ferredoxin oxidoreductase